MADDYDIASTKALLQTLRETLQKTSFQSEHYKGVFKRYLSIRDHLQALENELDNGSQQKPEIQQRQKYLKIGLIATALLVSTAVVIWGFLLQSKEHINPEEVAFIESSAAPDEFYEATIDPPEAMTALAEKIASEPVIMSLSEPEIMNNRETCARYSTLARQIMENRQAGEPENSVANLIGTDSEAHKLVSSAYATPLLDKESHKATIISRFADKTYQHCMRKSDPFSEVVSEIRTGPTSPRN